ncbi:MAG: nucleoside deaminase [Rikenellaceae bacterium]
MIGGKTDNNFMLQAISEAKIAYKKGEVPIGAVISDGTKIIARAHNLTELLNDATAHAEMQAITAASDYIGGKYLKGCTIYVTIEPCPMCAAALAWAQIDRVVYGAKEPKRGYTTISDKLLHPKTTVLAGVMESECRELMEDFFKKLR